MKILVDPQYNPSGNITSSTKLGPGITCAKFLGAVGSRTQFDRLYNEDFTGPVDRAQVARNLILHARAMNMVLSNPEFAQHRLIVSDGIYEPYQDFTAEGYFGEVPLTGSINDLRRTGRAIGYQLIDKNGKTDPRKSFDLAVYWKDYLDYNELELAYDTFDPSGELTASIILTMPRVPESFDVTFNDREGVDFELLRLLGDTESEINMQFDGYRLKTTYNGTLQARNELLEILPD